jgi:hypothetical protein
MVLGTSQAVKATVTRILLSKVRKLETRRTDLMDTGDWAHREMLRRLRAMTPGERLQIAFDRITSGIEIHRLAMSRVAEERAKYSDDRR